MRNKFILLLTVINLAKATLLLNTNSNQQYWTQDKIDSAIPFSYNIVNKTKMLGFIQPFTLPSSYFDIKCPVNWTDTGSGCTLPGYVSRVGFFNFNGGLYVQVAPNSTCPANTNDEGPFSDGTRHCNTGVYLGYDNFRTVSYINGVLTLSYPILNRTTLNQNNRPDWNTGRLFFTYNGVNAYCNAVVITNSLLITSAHCVENGGTLYTNMYFQSSRGNSQISTVVYPSSYDTTPAFNNIKYDYAFLKLNTQVTPGYLGILMSQVDNSNGLNDLIVSLNFVDNNLYFSPLFANATFDGVYTFQYNLPYVTGGETLVSRYTSGPFIQGTNSVVSVISVTNPIGTGNFSVGYAPIFDGTTNALYQQIIS